MSGGRASAARDAFCIAVLTIVASPIVRFIGFGKGVLKGIEEECLLAARRAADARLHAGRFALDRRTRSSFN